MFSNDQSISYDPSFTRYEVARRIGDMITDRKYSKIDGHLDYLDGKPPQPSSLGTRYTDNKYDITSNLVRPSEPIILSTPNLHQHYIDYEHGKHHDSYLDNIRPPSHKYHHHYDHYRLPVPDHIHNHYHYDHTHFGSHSPSHITDSYKKTFLNEPHTYTGSIADYRHTLARNPTFNDRVDSRTAYHRLYEDISSIYMK